MIGLRDLTLDVSGFATVDLADRICIFASGWNKSDLLCGVGWLVQYMSHPYIVAHPKHNYDSSPIF